MKEAEYKLTAKGKFYVWLTGHGLTVSIKEFDRYYQIMKEEEREALKKVGYELRRIKQ